MSIVDYTSYAEIRTTCGVSEKELPDTELALEIYNNVLDLALAEVILPAEEPGPGPLDTRYLAIKARVRTPLQKKLYNLTRMFATYTVSLEVCTSLSMKAPKSIGDGKASLVRFSPEATFQDVIVAITKKLDEVRYRIENINAPAVASLPTMLVVKPARDPVTNT
jgi:hypothetical protein